MQIFVKGNSRQYVRDGRIVGYVGAAVDIENITISNGWLLQGEAQPAVTEVPNIRDHGFAQNRYNAMVDAGISPVDASNVTGYTP